LDQKTKGIQMDASTAAGTVGAGFGVFLLVLLVVGAISGLIVGGIARFLLPGPDPMSWPRTILYGIGGSWRHGRPAPARPRVLEFRAVGRLRRRLDLVLHAPQKARSLRPGLESSSCNSLIYND